jgi:2-keto-3-deoxy-6-phosphogluconate aldolase
VAEVTFRTEAAAEAIRRIASEVPDALLGAGTVLTAQHVRAAKAAGATFLVTPGYNPDVVKAAMAEGLLLVPAGASVVRFVPPLVIKPRHVRQVVKRLERALGRLA